MKSSEERVVNDAVRRQDKLGIDLNDSCVEDVVNMEIVNQYGQLLGEYSKLDDDLWLAPPPPLPHDAADASFGFCGEGRQWNIVSSSLTYPHEHTAALQSSEQANKSLTDGCMNSMEINSSPLNDSSNNYPSSCSPVSILRRSIFNETTIVTKRARSKHRHPGKECSHFRSMKCLHPKSMVKTRKISDLLQLHPVEINQPTELVKKCVHCDTINTPQWRDGPEGRKTLCNACGLQYKKGLLSTSYRPLKTVKPQSQVIKKCLHCESANTPQWRDGPLGRKTLCNACGIQYKKRLLSPDYCSTRNSRYSDSLPTHLPMDTAKNILFDPLQKNVQEMITSENSEIDHNCARKWKTIEYMTEEASETLASNSNSDPDFKPSTRKKLPNVEGKKCSHCESTRTPQWREGPLGRKTLCNACGVQYRNGRLFPEYRPLQSPTYDPSVHSHLPKRVEQMRMMEHCAGHATFVSNEQLA
ncbi:hypothetical protein vseg_004716 [Gypsophila vaccaria]